MSQDKNIIPQPQVTLQNVLSQIDLSTTQKSQSDAAKNAPPKKTKAKKCKEYYEQHKKEMNAKRINYYYTHKYTPEQLEALKKVKPNNKNIPANNKNGPSPSLTPEKTKNILELMAAQSV